MIVLGNQKLTTGNMSRSICILLAMLLLFSQMLVGAVVADNSVVSSSIQSSIEESIDGAADQLSSLNNLSDWAALALVNAGHPIPESYTSATMAVIHENKGSFSKVTDLERFVIALAAQGYDPQKYEGYNLIEGIFNHSRMLNQGINGPIYALLVLNSGSYNLPVSNQWNELNLIEVILEQQNSDGGWSLVAGGKSTVDITAMAITALSGFIHIDGVQSSVDNAVAWLSSVQLANGGFNDSGDNSESVAQVIIALSSLGVDAATFNKNGANSLEHLLSFRQLDGGFAHMSGLGTNGMATEQALLALLAYDSFIRGEGVSIYQSAQLQAMVDIHIEGPDALLAEGSASGNQALEALMNFANDKKIQLGIKDTSFGKYVNAIGDIEEGIYDGSGGWSFNVHRDGSWQFPAVGMADYELKQGDVMVVYYTDYSTKMVDQVIVEPAKPIEGQPFTVTVKQSNWNWDDNIAQVTPAAAVSVKIGDKSKVTDDMGVAHFVDGSSAGSFEMTVAGYRSDLAPSVVRQAERLVVASKKVMATYAVEGLDHTIATGAVRAEHALEGLEQLLTANNIPYVVKELSIGKYVSEIDNAVEGKLGGYDGWGYLVKRDGKWIFPEVGIADFLLEAGDHVVVYYTNYATDPVQAIELQPAMPKSNESFSILVDKATWDWDNGKANVSPAVGVEVMIGGLKAITDSNGIAAFTKGFPIGKHTITVTGNRANDAPSIVKATSDMYILGDQQQVSTWASSDVQKVMKYGYMYGVSKNTITFDAQRSITRAEYTALLLRLVGEQPLLNAGSSYKDVSEVAWYAGSIAKARQLGIIDRTIINFQPDNAITREDMAVMTAKALQLSADNTTAVSVFSDISKASAASVPYIPAVIDYGILYGSDGMFMPLAPVTREMAAAIAVRIHEK